MEAAFSNQLELSKATPHHICSHRHLPIIYTCLYLTGKVEVWKAIGWLATLVCLRNKLLWSPISNSFFGWSNKPVFTPGIQENNQQGHKGWRSARQAAGCPTGVKFTTDSPYICGKSSLFNKAKGLYQSHVLRQITSFLGLSFLTCNKDMSPASIGQL